MIISSISTRTSPYTPAQSGQKLAYSNLNPCDEDDKKKLKKNSISSPNLKTFLLYNSLDVCLSALSYFFTACGCLGWGQKLFPKHKDLINKHGAEISSTLNSVVSVSRVFLSPAITPFSLGLAATSPFINNRLYRWAEGNSEKRYNIANNTVYGIGILAKASKRFTCPSDAITALTESTVARLGRNATKDRLYSFMGTTSNPVSSREHIKTIATKLISKYSWNIVGFGIMDYLINLFQKGLTDQQQSTKS